MWLYAIFILFPAVLAWLVLWPTFVMAGRTDRNPFASYTYDKTITAPGCHPATWGNQIPVEAEPSRDNLCVVEGCNEVRYVGSFCYAHGTTP